MKMKKYIKPIMISLGLATITLTASSLLLFKQEDVQIGFKGGYVSKVDFTNRYDVIKSVYANYQIDIEKHPETRKYIRETLAKQMLEEKIYEKIAKEYGVKVTDEEIEDEIKNYKLDSNFVGLKHTRENMVKDYLLRRKLLIVYAAKLKVKEEDLRNYYEQNKNKYILPDTAEVSQIVVKDKKEAEEIVRKYNRGESFENLVKEYSKDVESKKLNGKIGLVTRDSVTEKIAQAIFSTNEGDISDIVETGVGYMIFKVEKKQVNQIRKFEEVKKEVEIDYRKDKTIIDIKKKIEEILEKDRPYLSV